MMHGPRQDILVQTIPAGAFVSDGTHTWKTPIRLSFPRKIAHTLTLSKPGFQSKVIQLKRKISKFALANVIIPFGVIGWGVDMANGSQWTLIPDTVKVRLVPQTARGMQGKIQKKNIHPPLERS